MTTLYQNLQTFFRGDTGHFSWRHFFREHIFSSWWFVPWLLLLLYITVRVVAGQFAASPVVTAVILLGWALTVTITAVSNVLHRHTPLTFWLSNNLYNSISSVFISLLIVLLLIAGVRGFFGWAFVRATFAPDAEVAAQTLSQWEDPGANWGAVVDNFRNLMVFRFPRAQDWRLWLLVLWNALLLIPSAFVFSRQVYHRSRVRRILTLLWVFTPVLAYLLLVGVGVGGPLPRLNPDTVWGGLLLTLIIAVFGIIASFPLGLLLALGRRSNIMGVPGWLTWLIVLPLTIYLLVTRTVPGLREATGLGQQLIALLPLLLPVVAYLFMRFFRGNVVAMLSTVYIEVVRGVPLITVLFMSIILFPIFLPPQMEVLSTWRVLAAVTFFAAAYLAENVRGGLQSIPKGQFEAADALGLGTARKYRLIVLPQALRAVIPAIVGQFIGLFKDTTLVETVGLIEFLGVANLISAQPDWLGVRREPYVFIALVYFIGNFLMASYSRRLERRLGVGER
ncbi:MAG: amino acid ABC transporter permease [Candidatus Promineofilum sp.]|nr:amino acid ABC transporter permease [Promineifilum sp.]